MRTVAANLAAALPPPLDLGLAGLGVQPLRGDLRTVLIKTHHDRHGSLLELAARTIRAGAGGLHTGQDDTRLMPSLRDR